MKRIAILASGNGSNFEIIAKKIMQNKIKNCQIIFLFSNKPHAYVIERAKNMNIKTITFKVKDFDSKKIYNEHLLQTLLNYKIDYIICAGYLLIIPSIIIDAFPNRIINLHPSYLPNFKGLNAIEQAYKSSEKYTGITVHYVIDKLDAGNIILQKKIKINHRKSLLTLETKIHKMEYKYFYKAINKVINI